MSFRDTSLEAPLWVSRSPQEGLPEGPPGGALREGPFRRGIPEGTSAKASRKGDGLPEAPPGRAPRRVLPQGAFRRGPSGRGVPPERPSAKPFRYTVDDVRLIVQDLSHLTALGLFRQVVVCPSIRLLNEECARLKRRTML